MNETTINGRATVLRLKQVSSRVGLGRTAIYARVKDGSFPTPVSLGGNAVGWIEAEIEEWIVARVEASRSGTNGLTFAECAKKAAAVRWKKPDAGCAPLCVSAP